MLCSGQSNGGAPTHTLGVTPGARSRHLPQYHIPVVLRTPSMPHSEGPTAATVALLGVIKNYRDLQRPLTIGLLSLSSDRGQFTVDFTDRLLLSQLLIGFKFTEEGIECTSLRL